MLQPDATPLGWRQSDTRNLNNDSPILRASRLQLSRSRQFPRGGFVLPQVAQQPYAWVAHATDSIAESHPSAYHHRPFGWVFGGAWGWWENAHVHKLQTSEARNPEIPVLTSGAMNTGRCRPTMYKMLSRGPPPFFPPFFPLSLSLVALLLGVSGAIAHVAISPIYLHVFCRQCCSTAPVHGRTLAAVS